MRVCFVALIAAALAGPALADSAPPTMVSPLVVTAPPKAPAPDAKVEMGGDGATTGDIVAVWPATAYQTRRNGRVTLSCLVDVHGLAEWCKVASEAPAGHGFGKAALQLRPTFVLKPATGPDGAPVNRVMNIAIAFKAPADTDTGTERTRDTVNSIGDAAAAAEALRSATSDAVPMRSVTMVDKPLWAQVATFDDLARAYPANGERRQGYAAAHCRVETAGSAAGALRSCQIIKEAPQGAGFGEAALSLAPKFRIAPASLAAAPRGAPLWVDVPIRFAPPTSEAARVVAAPSWLAGFDAKATPKVFPPEADDLGVTSGRGMARCRVGSGGAVTECAPERAEPEGLGFSEAVARLATTMKMNLWSADAAPVEGGVVYVAMRLNLKEKR